MPSLLEALLGGQQETVERVRKNTGDDSQRAEQAVSAAIGTLLRGLEKKTETKEGADGLWEMLRKHVDQGNIPAQAPARDTGIQVKDLDPQVTEDIMSVIFGKDAPKVQGGIGKVITLDPETTKKVLGQVLPAILGGVFGEAEKAPEESPRALPNIFGGARKEIEERQHKARGIFDMILDRDGDGDVDLGDLAGILAGK